MKPSILYDRIDPKTLKIINQNKDKNVFSAWAEVERQLLKLESVNDLTIEHAFLIFQVVHPEQEFNLSKLFKIFSYERQ